MKEAALERRLVQAVRKAGGLCIKLPAILYRGIPDRMILLPGATIFFVELKADGGRVSVHQDRYRTFLHKLGFKSFIIEGLRDLEAFMDQIGIAPR